MVVKVQLFLCFQNTDDDPCEQRPMILPPSVIVMCFILKILLHLLYQLVPGANIKHIKISITAF